MPDLAHSDIKELKHLVEKEIIIFEIFYWAGKGTTVLKRWI